jgi:ferredoxin-thioredoxin reductase catalytic chain
MKAFTCVVSIFGVLLLQPAAYAFAPIAVAVAVAARTIGPPVQVRVRVPVTLHNKANNMSEEEYQAAMEKATKSMTAFTNKYLQNTCTTLCTDKSVPAVVIKGLAEHKVALGTPLCPCRFYADKEAEAKDGFWNCPCVPMRERHECHCMLFLTEDNAFAGKDQVRPHKFKFGCILVLVLVLVLVAMDTCWSYAHLIGVRGDRRFLSQSFYFST